LTTKKKRFQKQSVCVKDGFKKAKGGSWTGGEAGTLARGGKRNKKETQRGKAYPLHNAGVSPRNQRTWTDQSGTITKKRRLS